MATRELRGKVIVITGASSGIGAATAVACGKAGMGVVLAARREAELMAVADRVRASGASSGGQAWCVRCDVTVEDDVAGLFEAAVRQAGRVDAVFANAGYGLFKPMLETSDAEDRAIFETNYFGSNRTVRHGVAALRATREKHGDALGHVLVCSSSASEIGVPRMGPYCATKAAQDACASALRAELAQEGVAVTSVHPVGTSTEFFGVMADQSGDGSIRANTPVPLSQTSEQVAAAIVRALRRPRAEVWPAPWARWMLAMATLVPSFGAFAMARHERKTGG
ncbi:MAG: SDR family NAD(P)-dependent oxidoreductase [Planctomycetota bacterium]